MNELQIIKGEVNKGFLKSLVANYLQDDKYNPLLKYVNIKAVEIIIKEILASEDFRKQVKEDYLHISGGSLSKSELYGVEIKTSSNEKKIELKKDYEYSYSIKQLEKDISFIEETLKIKKDNLKKLKLLEINSGTAKIMNQELLPEVETDILDTFNLVVTFKQ